MPNFLNAEPVNPSPSEPIEESSERALLNELVAHKVEEELKIELRKAAIIQTVKSELAKGIPVEITEEMRDLEIDGEVLKLAELAGMAWKLNQHFVDEDDIAESGLMNTWEDAQAQNDPYFFLSPGGNSFRSFGF